MLAPAVVIIGLAVVALVFRRAFERRELRAVALRNVRSRPGRAILVSAGVLLATATLATAAVIADSLRASIRQSAFTQLGPVDEEIVGRDTANAHSVSTALERSPLAGIDGMLAFETLTATVRGRDFLPRVAQAQVIELDFARAAGFGGDPSQTGISGPTPTDNGAVMNADLSRQISIGSGHRVTVFAFGTSRTFRISRVLPRVGLAGLQTPRGFVGSASPNLFVPLGTLASMRTQGHADGAPPVTSIVAVSNRGGVISSRASADAVTAALRRATNGLAVEVLPVKQLLLDDANRSADQFGATFRLFGTFSVLGGLLLLVLTFGALALERARSTGILRALGLTPREVAATLVLEGFVCCVLGAALGAAVGMGMGALVVRAARGVLNNVAAGGIEVAPSIRVASVVLPAAIGLVASLGLLTLTAWFASHREVVSLLHGEPGSFLSANRHLGRMVGPFVCAIGIATAIVGIVAGNTIAAVVGASLVVTAAALVSASPYRQAVAVGGATVLVMWTVFEVGTNSPIGSGPDAATLVVAAAIMGLAAVTVVGVVHRTVAGRRTAGRRHTAAFALGLAYAYATPLRTAIISAMYASVAFTVCFVATVAHLYGGNIDTVARELGGQAKLEVTSNSTQPLSPRDVEQLPGVTRVTSASSLDVHLLAAGAQPFSDATLVGIDNPLIGHGLPNVTRTASGMNRDSVYEQVVSDSKLIVVGANLQATTQSTLDHRIPHVGDVVQLQDPTTGNMTGVRVAALVADARYQGADHIYASDALLRSLHRAAVPRNVLYVETAAGTNNDTLAAIIDGTHLSNGTFARSFHRLAGDRLSAQRQFLDILTAYTALGLIAGTVALAVAMIDRVRERRRQLAMLRAIGLQPKTLRRALRIEASIICLEATLAGTLAAILLAWRLATTGKLADIRTFTPPIATLAVIFATVLLGALAGTTAAARRAARIEPANALRAEE